MAKPKKFRFGIEFVERQLYKKYLSWVKNNKEK
jgi:hypothetical protein